MSMTTVLRAALAVPILGGMLASPTAARADHHHIHNALYELEKATVELKEADHDYGGHRAKALLAVEGAMFHMNKLLVIAGEKPVSPKPDAELYKAYKHNPHMHHALKVLKEAHKQIKESKTDFGDLREKTLVQIDYAIGEIEICLKNHEKKK